MQKLNTQAIAALQAGKYDEGSALLLRILKIPGREKDMGTAYNLACAYSLKGDVDKGFEWLERSVDWGWGAGTGQLVGETKQKTNEVMTRTDPDLENLREDPRFEKVMERMSKAVELRESRRKQGEEYAATPAIYIPEKVQGLAEMPLLVVLHDAGSTKDLVVAGRWKQIADELGFALVAPSGKLLLGDEPAQGMTWFDDRAEYKSSYWKFEKPITDAYSAFKKEHPIDKDRVVIAGEGMGGLVALNTAIGSPSWFKGVVALNGSVDPELMGSKAPTAGKMGLRVKLLVELDETSKRLKAAGDASGNAAKAIEAWSRSLQTWGVTGEVKTVPADPDANPATMNRLLVESVKAVLQREPAPAKDPAPAPPGKGTDQ
jgi:S-formylglutathione hydrolase FrmB